jgi:hypothetical protein
MGYQEGGMEMMQPQMQDQMQQAPEGIMSMMPQGASGGQQGMSEEKGKMSLAVIIKLLIDQGIDPETAKEIALQIVQAFAQGGEPAVEALADKFDQQMDQAPVMMATGGLTNLEQAKQMLQDKAPKGEFLAYINSREASVLKRMGGAGRDINNTGVPSFIFKAIGKAIKSISKSTIGKIALTVAAVAIGGPMLAGTFGMSAAAGAAWAGGLANSALQLASGQKFNPLEALISAGGAYVGAGGLSGTSNAAANVATDAATTAGSNLTTSGVSNLTTDTLASNLGQNAVTGTITQPSIPLGSSYSFPTVTPDVTGTITQPSSFLQAPTSTGMEGLIGTGYATAPANQPFQLQGAGSGSPIDVNAMYDYSYPGPIDKLTTSASNFGTDILNKIQTGAQNLYQDPFGTIKDFAGSAYDYAKKEPAIAAIGISSLASLAQQPGETDEEYYSRAARDPEVQKYITLYGGGTKLYSPEFYKATGAVDPFAGRSTFVANGGRIGYEYGSMPMGEPRQNPEGIMELDYRKQGGFVPPIGIKEKADDIPAMLSNNEFVFTANAVRNAGGGNVNKGAQRMYGLMKQLEAGGVV